MDGLVLNFHLAGINNQNFLMRDEQTGTFWQQISGKAVSGPLAGKQMRLVHSDELTFATWRKENPGGAVLEPVAQFASEYEAKDWDVRLAKAPSVVDTKATGRKPRELMLGIEAFGGAKAFPLERVLAEKLVLDAVHGEPVLIVVGEDGKSVRAFQAKLTSGASPDFYRITQNPPAPSALMMDSETGSGWDFRGCAVSGKAQGQCLRPVDMLKDYWFDWHLYHPQTAVYQK